MKGRSPRGTQNFRRRMRGFFFLRYGDGRGNAVYLASHDGQAPIVRGLGRGLGRLILPGDD